MEGGRFRERECERERGIGSQLTGMGGPPSREASEGLRQEVEGFLIRNADWPPGTGPAHPCHRVPRAWIAAHAGGLGRRALPGFGF